MNTANMLRDSLYWALGDGLDDGLLGGLRDGLFDGLDVGLRVGLYDGLYDGLYVGLLGEFYYELSVVLKYNLQAKLADQS